MNIGDTITTAEALDALPVGSRTQRATRIEGGWLRNNGACYSSEGMLRDYGTETIEHIGQEQGETFTHYVQRFITQVLGAAHANGVSRTPVNAVLTELGLVRQPLIKRLPLHTQDREVWFPRGLIVEAGDRNHWPHYSVVKWNGNDWGHVTGGLRQSYTTGHVILNPDLPDQEFFPGNATDEDAHEIHAFKVRAYRLGQAAKRTNAWCAEYERAMRAMGIDEGNVSVPSVPLGEVSVETPQWEIGQTINRDQFIEVPNGALMVYRNGDHMYVIDHSLTDPACRNVIDGESRWGGTTAQNLAWLPGTEMRVPITNANLLGNLPQGTVIEVEGVTSYTKVAEQGQWQAVRPNGGGAMFGISNFRDVVDYTFITSIPGIN